ncbi:FOLATE-BIOPTERIN TRANSPORTER 3-RELATED [Salix viminalis]|uniref:FOLATE-BIOPTERIN TRANSPORTER 3-RELATED n=1 Tax=Salix viminalis TaxID=40686 RepID=A0A9Q0YXM0_SALVM|nr:FOLATE-BIOPTERIN TRANSPORTER 3-RELATED [Salix viminalis]
MGAVGSLAGVLIYQNWLKDHPFRDLLFWSQLLYGASGLLDLILVLRLNLKIGLPDYFFVVIDEAVSMMIGRIKWQPLLVLSSKLCPAGIEGTFFALLMSIDHVGMLSSTWVGGLLLKFLKVTRTEFDSLWDGHFNPEPHENNSSFPVVSDTQKRSKLIHSSRRDVEDEKR